MSNEKYDDLFTAEDEKPIDYKAILFEYLMYWPWFVACLILCLIGAWGYLRYQTPVYNVNATVLIKQDDKGKGSANSPLATMQDLGMLSMASNFDNEMEILRSRTLIKKVVNTLGLNIRYAEPRSFGYARPLYKHDTPIKVWMTPEEAEKLAGSLSLQLDCTPDGKVKATAKYIQNGKEGTTEKTFDRLPGVLVTPVGTLTLNAKDSTKIQEERTIQVQIVSPTSAAQMCQRNLSTEPTSKQTTIVRLNYNDTHVGRGLDFLNTLVALYNADANDDKNEVASRTAEFIDERISIINHELGTTESELAQYKQKAGLTDLTSDAQLALQGNAEYEQKRAENATQLRLVEFLKEYIERPENRKEIIPANIGLSDNGLSTLIGQYNEMLTERKRLLRTSSESNPAVVNLDTSLEATRKNIQTSVASVLKGLEITRNDLNREAVAAAAPQVIFDTGEAKKGAKEDLDARQEQLGIPVIFIEAKLSDYGAAYERLGELLSMEERGSELSTYCTDVYNKTVTTMENIPENERVRMAYLLGDNGLNAIAKTSLQAAVVDMVADNVGVVVDVSG